MRDEAPAATIGGVNEIGFDRLELGSAGVPGLSSCSVRPASLLRKSILDVRPAGICDGWLHCSIQVACQPKLCKICRQLRRLAEGCRSSEASFTVALKASCLTNRPSITMPNYASSDRARQLRQCPILNAAKCPAISSGLKAG